MGCCFSCICSDNSKEVELFSMEIINEGKVRKIYKCGSSIGPLVCKTIPIKTNSWKREIPTLKSLVGMDEYFQQFSHITRTETEICIFSRALTLKEQKIFFMVFMVTGKLEESFQVSV